MSLRIIFMGTPDFAVPTLTEIVGHGHEVAAVYSQPPRPAGRGMAPRLSPVHARAEQLGLKVLTPENFKAEETRAEFAAFDADVAVVVAYGLLLPEDVLEAPDMGCLNLHGSLLPRWRGAAPLNRAIMAGDSRSGVMVMKMEKGLDTGPVAMAEEVAITADMTAGDLHDRLSAVGADLMIRALAALSRGGLVFTPQAEDGVTYARKIEKAEARIDWSPPSAEVSAHIRGLSPFPGAWFEADLGKGVERVKVLRTFALDGNGAPGTLLTTEGDVACGEGAIRLVSVQRAGGKPMAFADFLRGTKLMPGESRLAMEAEG
ncbi:Methionyl-tRNA formyltransferase [Hartmannibacter diazotrophicus]|uniref:Methionyl-tRNA formyltransferase n=1 Tax=Hartmannibacter diazotrophicus TaxID=1482074 RepID=A0A2C9D0C7_9HYPH|nr:methionyl-tRNA formyltransferase [Hartmannibacter diazotrophicus]SON53649.1 Methionyl-tRNA formyltransferase [Hartmannibacter diazotrophicus]